jgi:hypothetical protein
VAPPSFPITSLTGRQRNVLPNTLGMILLMSALIYQFAAFGVYWLVTGSGTIGVGGTLTGLGNLLFLVPLPFVCAGLFVGPRGWFGRFFRDPVIVTASRSGLAISRGKPGDRVVPWEDVGGISVLGQGEEATRVFDVQGWDTITLPAAFNAGASRRNTTIAEMAIAVRPDRYRPIDERRPRRGCVLRSVP